MGQQEILDRIKKNPKKGFVSKDLIDIANRSAITVCLKKLALRGFIIRHENPNGKGYIYYLADKDECEW